MTAVIPGRRLYCYRGAANSRGRLGYPKGIESWEKHTEKGVDWRDVTNTRTLVGRTRPGRRHGVRLLPLGLRVFDPLGPLLPRPRRHRSARMLRPVTDQGPLQPARDAGAAARPPHTCAKPGCKKAAKHTCSVCESVT